MGDLGLGGWVKRIMLMPKSILVMMLKASSIVLLYNYNILHGSSAGHHQPNFEAGRQGARVRHFGSCGEGGGGRARY